MLMGRRSSVNVGEKRATPRAQSIPTIDVSRQDKWVPSACILFVAGKAIQEDDNMLG